MNLSCSNGGLIPVWTKVTPEGRVNLFNCEHPKGTLVFVQPPELLCRRGLLCKAGGVGGVPPAAPDHDGYSNRQRRRRQAHPIDSLLRRVG